jgi:hypothetical protein
VDVVARGSQYELTVAERHGHEPCRGSVGISGVTVLLRPLVEHATMVVATQQADVAMPLAVAMAKPPLARLAELWRFVDWSRASSMTTAVALAFTGSTTPAPDSNAQTPRCSSC